MADLMHRIRWYGARLAAMERGELPFRVREALRKRAWMRRIDGWGAYEQIGDGEIGDLSWLRDRLASAGGTCPELLSAACADLAGGTYGFLGQRPFRLFQGDGTVDPGFWFTDPLSGQRWPGAQVPAFRVPVRWTGKGTGDVKFVWEPNRLQFLQPLAAAIASDGNPRLTESVLVILRAWAQANPPGRGVNWVSGIELALRLVSLACVVAAIGPDNLGSTDRTLVRRLAAAHGHQLAAFPSRYSSANNHLVAEALGLLVASRLVPDLPEARSWARSARAIIEAEAQIQIHPDGVGAEQSPTYHAFTMEMIALALLFARGTVTGFSSAVEQRLAAGARFICALADEAGNVPAIGDDDEGRVIGNGVGREAGYAVSVAAAVGGLLGQPQLAALPRIPALRDAVFASPPPDEATLRPVPDVQVFPCGGYTVVRDEIAARRLHLVFDHGPLGHGALAAHGHADALALWLTVDGQPVFVDAGTYLYHSGGDQRTLLRESGMHNTLTIAGRSLATASGAFGWKTRADAEFLMVRTGADWAVAGRHDGFVRSHRASHVRRIEKTVDGFSVCDALEGAAEVLPVGIRFLCAPDLKVSLNGTAVSVSGPEGRLLDLAAPDGFSAAVASVAYSPRFGECVPTRQIVFSGALAPGAVARTVILPLSAREVAAKPPRGTVIEAAWAKTPRERAEAAAAGSES